MGGLRRGDFELVEHFIVVFVCALYDAIGLRRRQKNGQTNGGHICLEYEINRARGKNCIYNMNTQDIAGCGGRTSFNK